MTSQALQVDIWFDLLCPWCLIGKRHVERARELLAQRQPDLCVELRWHGVQLLPDVPTGGVPFREFYAQRLGGEDAVRLRQAQVVEAAQRAGVAINFERIARLPNTAAAHRALDWCAAHARAEIHERLLDRLFSAYFIDGEDIGDTPTLLRLAGACGADAGQLAACLGSGATRSAPRQGIADGVPCFVFNRRVALTGAQPPEVLLDAMHQALSATRHARDDARTEIAAMSTAAITTLNARGRQLFPGVVASVVVAAAASFLSEHYAAPVMLFALLLGMAMNFLAAEGACNPGIEFAARTVLRVGVALLGIRITLAQIVSLGWHPVALVVLSVALTILLSIVVARALGFEPLFGMLTGGATAICGASAALALAAALPAHPGKERATLFTIIGVSALSTLAMIAYPMIVNALGMTPQAAGVFLGRDHTRRGTGGRRGLQRLARNRRCRDRGEADARRDAAAGDRLRGDDHARARRWRGRHTPAAAAVVRGGLHPAGGGQQHRVDRAGGAAVRQRAVALVPGDGHQRHRHEDAAARARHRRHQADRADARRNRVPRAAGAGAVALGGLSLS